jgi:hypothetical protein
LFFFRTEVRPSPIEGQGVFAGEPIAAGTLLGILTYRAELISEEEYQRAQYAGDQHIIQCAVRLVGTVFAYVPPRDDQSSRAYLNEDSINHSADPSMLYHCGLLFARRAIAPGDELTVDYKYFLAEDDVQAFTDVQTGNLVRGVDGEEALLASTRELMALLPSFTERSKADPWAARVLAPVRHPKPATTAA